MKTLHRLSRYSSRASTLALVLAALGAATLVGCGDDDDDGAATANGGGAGNGAAADGGAVDAEQPSPVWSGTVTVETAQGTVEGLQDEADTLCWRSIPFARPPVGELRWKAPQPPEAWEGVRQATEFTQFCTQYHGYGMTMSDVKLEGTEDCLYLNIWRPRSDQSDLPVYFWIHGGGNSIQLPVLAEFSGANLARASNVVVVTIHYRLGPFGWLSHPALRAGEDALDDSGNFGTLDIIRALEWVQENIAAFGGDPENVMITGESAGGSNVFTLMISSLASGIFHRAIAESGGTSTATPAEGEQHVDELLEKLLVIDGTAADAQAAATHRENMSTEEIETYLRSKTAFEIMAGYEGGAGGMISFPNKFVDGTVLPEEGFERLDTGDYPNQVPIIMGTNKDESKLFMAPRYMDGIIGGTASQEEVELYNLIAGYSSDLWKVRGADDPARKMSAHQSDVYVYQFLWGSVREDGSSSVAGPYGTLLGAYHGIEIDFFFNIETGLLGPLMFSEQNRPGREALTSAVMSYAAQFLRTGNPGSGTSGDLPEWQAWSNESGDPKCILLDADPEVTLIEMSTVELTTEGILQQLEAEPRREEIEAGMDLF